MKNTTPQLWTYPTCLSYHLPFHNVLTDDILDQSYHNPEIENGIENGIDTHIKVLTSHPNHLKLMHLNTQSLVSSFNEFSLMFDEYKFDLLTLSETWLKDNEHLLNYIDMPGYTFLYNNRNHIRGGVGCYVSNNITNYKRRKDIERTFPQLEHLWVEIPGKNKHSRVLVGVMYRSELILPFNEWHDQFQNLISYIKSTWKHPFIITGDINVDLLDRSKPETTPYMDTIDQFNLKQIVTKPTRVTPQGQSLIDHILVSDETIVTHTDVLPCGSISDHDAVYSVLNVRKPRFTPRFKYIRNERNFVKEHFIQDASILPFSVVYAFDDADNMLDTFSSLISECIEKHAPMKRVKITRPCTVDAKSSNS